MHEIAATVGSASIILIGIISSIFYNQRGLNRLEVKFDVVITKVQDEVYLLQRKLGQHDKAIEVLSRQ